jgi:hypothetical protein
MKWLLTTLRLKLYPLPQTHLLLFLLTAIPASSQLSGEESGSAIQFKFKKYVDSNFYGFETSSLTLLEEGGLRVYENKVVERTFENRVKEKLHMWSLIDFTHQII